ncbi:MAG: alanine--tRNA ligase [Oscillospiraceae bacterium]|jgi:alanyl-tRNA synthetase|nr:alanine--tRNA ligase [Oscillospiraceae bacterium]
MQWMSLNGLREKYLAFFEEKGHLRLNSFPLIPDGDRSLLLINSGMAPMKKYFTGEVTPPRKRVTTCQKCIRTPDIERVGKTARHGTFFEMLGNFSFGDYFKKEATAWAWEFCTKVLEMPADRVWVTIFRDDDEAFEIWTKLVGVNPDRIVRLGKEDNFWEHGSGPCGPCSEIHFDRGDQYGCGSPDCGPGCDCDRYVEFWNLVFTQFESDGAGNYTPLDHPNIDTGMGLERLACVVQGVDNLFEVDSVAKILEKAGEIAGVKYKTDDHLDVSLRVITDHIRSCVFMLSDGVLPSNEGRGYVLRRLIRRAARHGRILGVTRPFLAEVAGTAIGESRAAYPELAEKRETILKMIAFEEESFSKTIDQGLALLEQLSQNLSVGALSGADAFRLYDTFGFPFDLTLDILEEKGLTADEEGFTALMQSQRERSRAARKGSDGEAWAGNNLPANETPTEFVGYDRLSATAQVKYIIAQAGRPDSIEEGDSAVLILDKTPFYGESGGQAGDVGELTVESGRLRMENDGLARQSENCAFGAVFKVYSTTKNANGLVLHHGELISGTIKVGDMVTAAIDREKREATTLNHTAAHLLQAALRQVLGAHVEQAGQSVDSARLRFDFTHFSALTGEEIKQAEGLVNGAIIKALPVTTEVLPVEEAKKRGAMALFGEKYGDTVRLVSAGDFSKELCGGTHTDNTVKIRLFEIVSESSVSAGVRRIEAFTGEAAADYLRRFRSLSTETAAVLKAAPEGLPERAAAVLAELKEKDRLLEKQNAAVAAQRAERLAANAADVGGARLATQIIDNADADTLRNIGDSLKAAHPDLVAVLACINREKGAVTLAAVCGGEAVKKGAHAGNLVRELAKLVGGSGGGRPDSAMAGGKKPEELEAAMAQAVGILKGMLK